jgi:hypothetical protein
MRVRSVLVFVAAGVVAAASIASAQSDPRTLPGADFTNLRLAGTWTYDWPDGAGNDISYGGNALGVSEDGRYLYISCHPNNAVRGIAKLEIPAIGGQARVVSPCQGPTYADLSKLLPAQDGGQALVGGVFEQGGRVCVTGYWSYDANDRTLASHWCGPSLTQLAGPFKGTVRTGLVKSQMASVPSEWRALLGGPAFSTAGYTSIIGRASYGASLSVFNPADVTRNDFPMTLLLGCPIADPATGAELPQCRDRYGSPTSDDFNGSELSGGSFIVPGTRTLVAIEREASGPTCYGYATRDPLLQGTPYPTAANPSPENVTWCYSLADPMDEKGPKGYPYRLVAKLYDLNELVNVKQGTKKPWDIRQYATVELPGSNPGVFVTSGTYNPVRGEYYLIRNSGGGINEISVYSGFGQTGAVPPPPPPPPPTEICGDGIDNDGDGLIDEGCPPPPVEVCGDGIDNDRDGTIDEGCESVGALPGEPNRLYGSVKRSAVTLKWFPPLTGGAVTDYVLEAGLSPGDTFFTAEVGTVTTLNVPNVATGRYYVRVRGRNGNGLGAPSNEVTLSVGCRTKPSRVSSLTATTRGALVTFNWTDPDGCSGTTYQVTVASSVLSTEERSATTVLPQGTYVARVVAQSDNGAGDATDVQFTVAGGGCVTPRFRTTLRSVIAGRRIGLFWSPLEPDLATEDDRLTPVSYQLEAGTAPGASDIGVLPMARAAQFLTDAPAGTYFVRVRPTNACGGGGVSNEAKLVVR